jgi:tRNA-dihydrouridine synthase A
LDVALGGILGWNFPLRQAGAPEAALHRAPLVVVGSGASMMPVSPIQSPATSKLHGAQKSAATSRVEDIAKTGITVGKSGGSIDRRVSVAPMMDWTTRHCRFFLRQFSPHALLYTEMINAYAILRGNAARLLRYSPEEQPLAIQLGGSEPALLAAAARIAADAGYVEVNLNCGCPSDRVAAGAFGACLMQQPQLVAECVAAMKQAVRLPVTVKYRVGVVDRQSRGEQSAQQAALGFDAADAERLEAFTQAIVTAGVDGLIVHARKAVLGGLSPHENRTVPPLRIEEVAALRARYPRMPLVINGGFRTREAVAAALRQFDGVMIGREAYHRPMLLAELHGLLYPDAAPAPGLETILAAMRDYTLREVARGTPMTAITRHMLGLLAGRPGAKALRQVLSEDVRHGLDATEVFGNALALVGASA